MAKRAWDVGFTLVALVTLCPVLIAIGLAILIKDGRPVLFAQTRVGRNGRPFRLLKFRTMRPSKEPALATSNPGRITPFGGWLRRTKLDELPQLLNVLAGHMSVVGPRPELPIYVRLYDEKQRQVLKVRPGLTDPATLEWLHESDVLSAAPNPERAYVEQVMPAKLARSIDYLSSATLWRDARVLGQTLAAVGRRFGKPTRVSEIDTTRRVSDGARSNGIPPLAVVGATFFGYTEAVVEELRDRGIRVLALDEKRSNSLLAKIVYRAGLGHFRGSPLARYHRRLADQIIASNIPDVLLLGPEVVGVRFVRRLTRSGVRVHLHMWDAERNQGRFSQYRQLLTTCATFDPRDAQEKDMTYLPLFAEPVFGRAREMSGGHGLEISFCGTVHSSRGAVISRLLAKSESESFSPELMLYYHSRLLFFMKALFDWRLFGIFSRVSSRPYPKESVARLFAGSRMVLDLPHPKQSGLTIRTFEALLAGARLVTTNPYTIRMLPASLAARVDLVERPDDEVIQLLRVPPPALPALSKEEEYFLSLARFVDQILDLISTQTSSGHGAEIGMPASVARRSVAQVPSVSANCHA